MHPRWSIRPAGGGHGLVRVHFTPARVCARLSFLCVVHVCRMCMCVRVSRPSSLAQTL